jgi:hypothetical protein
MSNDCGHQRVNSCTQCGAQPSDKEVADALRLMCKFSMSVCIEADSKEVIAVFYGARVAREPCANGREAVAATVRAINRCAVMAAEACGIQHPSTRPREVDTDGGQAQ